MSFSVSPWHLPWLPRLARARCHQCGHSELVPTDWLECPRCLGTQWDFAGRPRLGLDRLRQIEDSVVALEPEVSRAMEPRP
jgi:hypothetical protein